MKTSGAEDLRWMEQALRLARRGIGRTRPNPPVGALVVKAGTVVGEGWHRRAGAAHAEALALDLAGASAEGATLYVTLEPCSTQGRTPPCTTRILASGVIRVVVGARDPNPVHNGRGIRFLKRHGIPVTEGLCAEEAADLLRPFAKWIATGLPYVTLKMGMTLDGRIADAKGRSKWITGTASRQLVRALRRGADAIMVGAGTVRVDDPSLMPATTGVSPVRLLVDACGCLRSDARALTDGRADRTVIATTRTVCARRARAYETTGATVWRLPSRRNRVSLKALMRRAGRECLMHILCEGGSELAAELLDQKLVDELVFFIAPSILGGSALPVTGGRGYALSHALQLTFIEVRRVGADVMIRAKPSCLQD